ncbi:hypothetical protein ACWGTO_06240 [Mesorhizobium sp. PL10]
MKLRALLIPWLSAARDFVAPRYRPELHYMRGPGPAFARRAAIVESRRVLPVLGDPHRCR